MTQTIDTKLVDQLLQGRNTPEEITGENGLIKQLTKNILERALQALPTVNNDDVIAMGDTELKFVELRRGGTSMRRAVGSNASRRCITQRLSHITTSPTCHRCAKAMAGFFA